MKARREMAASSFTLLSPSRLAESGKTPELPAPLICFKGIQMYSEDWSRPSRSLRSECGRAEGMVDIRAGERKGISNRNPARSGVEMGDPRGKEADPLAVSSVIGARPLMSAASYRCLCPERDIYTSHIPSSARCSRHSVVHTQASPSPMSTQEQSSLSRRDAVTRLDTVGEQLYTLAGNAQGRLGELTKTLKDLPPNHLIVWESDQWTQDVSRLLAEACRHINTLVPVRPHQITPEWQGDYQPPMT